MENAAPVVAEVYFYQILINMTKAGGDKVLFKAFIPEFGSGTKSPTRDSVIF